MDVMAKLARLFQRPEIPEEAQSVFRGAATPQQLRDGLEDLQARNEIDMRERQKKLFAIEEELMALEERIRRGGLGPSSETAILRDIKRLDKQRKGLDNEISIYDGNANVLLDLIARVQEMQAKRTLGVSEGELDTFLEKVEENFEEHSRVMLAGEGAARVSSVRKSAEEKELDEIRQRILGSKNTEPAKRDPRDKELE